jgi:hypothetical protein
MRAFARLRFEILAGLVRARQRAIKWNIIPFYEECQFRMWEWPMMRAEYHSIFCAQLRKRLLDAFQGLAC